MSAARKHTALAISVAFIAALFISGSASGGRFGTIDRKAPTRPVNVTVPSTTPSAVSLNWSPSKDNVGVAGYGVYMGGARVQSPSSPGTTVSGLDCGSAYSVGIDAFDAAGNYSRRTLTTVATAACVDLQAPSVPSGFRQQATAQDAVVLAWDPSTDNVGVVGYGVYRNGVLHGSTTSPTYTLSGLVCGSLYQVGFDAFDAAGNRSQQGSAWVQTAACPDTQAPTTPTALAVATRTETTIALSWSASTDNVGVTGYRVSVDSVAVQNTAQPGATLSNLVCGHSYAVTVDAYDLAGNRSGAATLNATTAACPPPPPPPADTAPPSQPGALTVTAATGTSVTLNWTASNDNVGVAGYGVYVNGTSVQTKTQPGATVSGLTCGTAYTLAVDAYDAAANRSTKASVVGTTSPCADTQAPTTPANVAMTSRTATSIALSWSASSDNVGVVGYGLYQGATLVGTTVGTTGILTSLACGTVFALSVDAYDAAGNRSTKANLNAATTACPDTTPPSTPAGLAASSVTGTSLMLGWNASNDNVGVTGYDVYRNGTKMGSVTSTSSSQTGLTCGTSYGFGVVAYDAAGNRSSQGQMTTSTGACPAPPPPPPPPPAPSPPPSPSITLTPVDGGPNYYAQFSNPLPVASTFFPIATWGSYNHWAAELAEDKAVGLTGYVWVADPANSANIRNAGMWAIQDTNSAYDGSETAGWLLADEIDMTQGPSACPNTLNSLRSGFPSDGRFVYNNYGKGVIFWETDNEAACFVNYDGVNSADIYWFSDGNVCGSSSEGPRFYGLSRALTTAECRRASNYGDVVSDMRRLDALNGSARHPIWAFVEVADWSTGPGARAPLPAEVRAAVWHSLIAGARGIIYFQHAFAADNPTCIVHHVLRENGCYQSMIDTVTSVNAQIKSIAPALNGPSVTSGFSASSSVRAAAKWDGTNFYVIAGSKENVSSTGSFSFPCVGNATATVLGESRTVPISAGSFSDSFADGNTVHVYRIDGGSRCGL